MSDEVLVLDVSRFQAQDPSKYAFPKKMNWQKALDNGMTGAIFRAGGGNSEDWTYEYNRSELERLGVPHGIYHAFYPTSNIDKQIEFVIGHACGKIPPGCDIERSGNLPRVELEARAKYYVKGVKPFPQIYTRATFWDYYIGRTDWASAYGLWVAYYSKTADKPNLPKDWKIWRFWQWSADKNNMGYYYGSPNNPSSIDMNRYNGTMEKFMSDYAENSEPPSPPEPPKGLKFQVLVPVLNIRAGAGTKYNITGNLSQDEIVGAENVGGDDSWIMIGHDENGKEQWSCVRKGTKQYMKLVEE